MKLLRFLKWVFAEYAYAVQHLRSEGAPSLTLRDHAVLLGLLFRGRDVNGDLNTGVSRGFPG